MEREGVLAPGVLAPCAAYPFRFAWMTHEVNSHFVCAECEGRILPEEFAVCVGPQRTSNRVHMHRDCWEQGAPWRRAVAERVKADAAMDPAHGEGAVQP